MTIKALFIDLDGTLVDSTPALYQVYLKFLSQYGHKGNREEFESLIGPSIDEIVEILQKKYDLKVSHQDLSTMYISTLMVQGFEGTELFPGAKEILSFAKSQSIKLAIVTSGTRALVKVCLEPLNVLKDFDMIITSEDVSKAKPNPDMYKLALDKFQIQPSEGVAIEDSIAGRDAALKAGLRVLFLTHNKPLPLGFKPMDGVIQVSSWSEVGEWLKSK